MELRNWVHERFGGTDESVLDKERYGDTELRKDIYKLEHQMKDVEQKMEQHNEQYKQYLKKGSEASEIKRRKYAQKAKFEKKKYKIKKKQYRANSVKLGTLLSIQGMREIMEMHDGAEDLTIDEVLEEEPDAQEMQAEIVDQMASFGVEMEDLQEIQDAIDMPILDDEIEMDHGEEMDRMEQMAASEISEEQVDLDADVEDVDAEELDDLELDEEFEEPELV